MVVLVGCLKRSHRLLANSSYRSGSEKFLPKPSCPIQRNVKNLVEAGFLEHLRILRSRAVDDALFQYHRDKDPMCAKLPNSLRMHMRYGQFAKASKLCCTQILSHDLQRHIDASPRGGSSPGSVHSQQMQSRAATDYRDRSDL